MKLSPGSFPSISRSNALPVLRELAGKRSLLAGMSAMNEALGNAFEITLPGFNPIVLSGPEAARELLVSKQGEVKWRINSDPVTQLLRHGLLVEDGESHDRMRSYLQPALKRSEIEKHIPTMLDSTDQVICSWEDGSKQDMLIEMRKVALIILMKTLFNVDITPDLERLWNPILRVLEYISPGLWILSPSIPRPGYKAGI
jgi:cytochrome P450